MPNHELVALRHEAISVLVSWLLIAAAAGAVAVVLRLVIGRVRAFGPQRLRATAWTGSLVGVAFLVFILARDIVQPYVDRASLMRILGAGEVSDRTARLLAYCAADFLALPLQLAAWAGLLTLAGRPPAVSWNLRRLVAGYRAGFRTWLVLTPLVYAVGFAAELVYRLVTREPPEGHPIVQVFQTGPTPSGVFALLLVQGVFVAPIKEEVFFRGILQPWLATKSWGGDLAVWLAAVIGVVIHGSTAGPVTDLKSLLFASAPVLLVFAVWPAYRLLDRRPLAWLPVRDPIMRQQVVRAIVGTSLLFANLHANVWPTPVPLFILALGLGWVAFRTQGLTAPIVVHMLFNAIVFASLALQPGPPPVPGP